MTISLTCKCGARLEIDESFAGRTISCPDCQRSLKAPKPDAPGVRTSGLALLSFILALVGAFTIVGTLAAVVVGLIALQQIKGRPDELTGRNFAVTGAVLGGLFTVLTGVALFSPEVFGLQNIPGQVQWAGKLDYDGPEKIDNPGGRYTIKRPSRQWGVRKRPKEVGDMPVHTWENLLLVNVPEDAHILVMQVTGVGNEKLGECRDKALEDFREKDKEGIFGRPHSEIIKSASIKPGKSSALEEKDDVEGLELEFTKTFARQERKFLMRVIREKGATVALVAIGGARSRSFPRVENDIREALNSFDLLRPE
jgi:hypothetical protein